eukprot:SAG25_NODE_162_length_13200_cov_4.969163_2_plen_515_part_00
MLWSRECNLFCIKVVELVAENSDDLYSLLVNIVKSARGYGATLGKLQDSLARGTAQPTNRKTQRNLLKRVWDKFARIVDKLEKIYDYAQRLITAYEKLGDNFIVTTESAGEAELHEVDSIDDDCLQIVQDAVKRLQRISVKPVRLEPDSAEERCKTEEDAVTEAITSAWKTCARHGIQQAIERYQTEYSAIFQEQMQVRVDGVGHTATDGPTKDIIHAKAMQRVLQWLQERLSNTSTMTAVVEGGPEILETEFVKLARHNVLTKTKEERSQQEQELLKQCWIEETAVTESHKQRQHFLIRVSDERNKMAWQHAKKQDAATTTEHTDPKSTFVRRRDHFTYILNESRLLHPKVRKVMGETWSKRIELKGRIKQKHWVAIGQNFAKEKALVNAENYSNLFANETVASHMQRAAAKLQQAIDEQTAENDHNHEANDEHEVAGAAAAELQQAIDELKAEEDHEHAAKDEQPERYNCRQSRNIEILEQLMPKIEDKLIPLMDKVTNQQISKTKETMVSA